MTLQATALEMLRSHTIPRFEAANSQEAKQKYSSDGHLSANWHLQLEDRAYGGNENRTVDNNA